MPGSSSDVVTCSSTPPRFGRYAYVAAEFAETYTASVAADSLRNVGAVTSVVVTFRRSGAACVLGAVSSSSATRYTQYRFSDSIRGHALHTPLPAEPGVWPLPWSSHAVIVRSVATATDSVTLVSALATAKLPHATVPAKSPVLACADVGGVTGGSSEVLVTTM